MKSDYNDTMKVIGASRLPEAGIPAMRMALGYRGDYKPCVARLTDGTLLLVDFHSHMEQHNVSSGIELSPEARYCEHMVMHRSEDTGRTWDEGKHLPLPGREPYLTVLKDGKIFITTNFLHVNTMNEKGYPHVLIHSSVDKGATWNTTVIPKDGFADSEFTYSTRNILERPDGVLMLGLTAGGRGKDYMLFSEDCGQSWKPMKITFKGYDPKEYPASALEEGVMFYSPSGRMMMCRIDLQLLRFKKDVPYLNKKESMLEGFDQFDSAVLFESKDGGLTWEPVRGIGFTGMMYPSFVPLGNGRLLYTFTVRVPLHSHMGVQAAVLEELEDGSFRIDLDKDRVVIDEKTPDYLVSGGGYGPTLRLDDEKFLTVYSYRDDSGKEEIKEKVFDARNFNEYDRKYPTKVEAAIWKIPDAWL